MAETIVVVGNGMVGQKLVDILVGSGLADDAKVVVLGEEPRPAYDRVHLSSYFDGRTTEDLNLADPAITARIDLRVGQRVARICRETKTIITCCGAVVEYDKLVLATGSVPFVPPLKGAEGPGCFVYRTVEDLDAIRMAASDASTGVVIGGGLLGLEAANALRLLGLKTHVVEMATRLMPLQVDDGGAAVLRAEVEQLGIEVHLGASTTEVRRRSGRASGLEFADGSSLAADVVVFSAGIRPRDELARQCGLAVGERGGIVVDDGCRTSDPDVYAIGECACHGGRVYGLVSPGYTMARVVADRLGGGQAEFTGADLSTKLKLLGVDVASFGDAQGGAPGSKSVVWNDPVDGVYRKLVVDQDMRLVGGVLVGDAGDYGTLHQLCLSGTPLPGSPRSFVSPAGGDTSPALGVAAIPDTATICNCNNVTKTEIRSAIADNDLATVAAVKSCTAAGTGCGSCVALVKSLLEDELAKAGVEVDLSLCEHFSHTRQELFDIVRVHRIRTFGELLQGWGTGQGCEVCKPAVASMLASLWCEYVLNDEHAPLQDTNDAFLANLQRDGSYSVVPRIPGGEITPQQLIVLGEVARDFDLYTKITGGQRIDLLGARVDQLPAIWRRLVDAGLESGHAYGKALRTVKSCVGTTWCRYGVQDSTSLAIELELRYRGLRSPHKIKSAVSGCARECAEAQSKDFGVIATDKGWNLYVCGNGGMRPQHAALLAQDLDTTTLLRYIDRFLMFYIRTADRLERTATWLNRLPGGIDYLHQVVVENSLRIADQLETDMQRHVDAYRCEWKATIEDPDRLVRFRHFVNDDSTDPTLAYVRERGQKRPARPEERGAVPVVIKPGTHGIGRELGVEIETASR